VIKIEAFIFMAVPEINPEEPPIGGKYRTTVSICIWGEHPISDKRWVGYSSNMFKPGESPGPVKDEIANLAYLLWEQDGKPEGQEKTHWIEAEDRWIAEAMIKRECR